MTPASHWLDGLLTAKEVLDLSIFRFKATLSGREMHYSYSFVPPEEMDRVQGRENATDDFPLLGDSEFEEELLAELGDDSEVELPENAPEGSRKAGPRLDLSTHGIGKVDVDLYIFDLDRRTLKMTTGDPRGCGISSRITAASESIAMECACTTLGSRGMTGWTSAVNG